MAKRDDLRLQRANTIINARSKLQEKAMGRALLTVVGDLTAKFPGIVLHHVTEWKLKDVVEKLRSNFPQVDFHYYFASSAMRPDGGILSLVDKKGQAYPILIAEKKIKALMIFALLRERVNRQRVMRLSGSERMLSGFGRP
jgi:hypothetical protein